MGTEGYLKKVQQDFSIKGTAISIVALQPIEAAKSHLLGQRELNGGLGNSSASKFFIETLKRNPSLLWKGSLINLSTKLPYNFSMYYTNVVMTSKLGTRFDGNSSVLTKVAKEFTFGALAGGLSASLVHQFELASAMVEGQKGGDSASLKDTYLKILTKDGLRGAYRFGVASVLHGSVFGGCFFVVYRTLPDLVSFYGNDKLDGMSRSLKQKYLLLDFLKAYPAALFGTMAAHPLDVLRTRTFATANTGKYNGTWDAAKKIYATEGISAFAHCWRLNFIQSVSAAALLVMVETIDKMAHTD